MNKKMYKQPKTNAHQVSTQNIICTSPIIDNTKQNGTGSDPGQVIIGG